MDTDTKHRIAVCTSCKHKGTQIGPGHALIDTLRSALRAHGDPAVQSFEVSAVACMAGCDRPCAVAYHATGKASYLFGDLDPETDIPDMVRFAGDYAAMDDGWCASVDRPGKLRTSTIARIPTLLFDAQSKKVKAS
ncbi:DUF1636 domain-containing protein [Nereida sp. MMG025]|uniref:DUF1636 family protein n=1 Tax=Nereida sp. MMG025 TaxID=2909981 RepID=UPI001F1D215D|nr:DUF1636 domain-containing protein [Nereida sp. MMG025]MCF6445180.1 DUF1636 domain-containing protein [Nereida sp. MMG025]